MSPILKKTMFLYLLLPIKNQKKTINMILRLLFFFQTLNIFSQEVIIEGIIIDSKTKEKISFANIGIQLKDIGTISNEKGDFKIHIPTENNNDTLSFSHLGFIKKQIPIKDLLKNKNTIELSREIKTLNEIKINVSIKKKPIKIGTQSYSSMVASYVRENNNKNNDIRELAKKIKTKKPIRINDININLFLVRIPDVKFRVNFYSEANGLPGDKVNTEEIIINTTIKDGWNTIDVSDYNLVFNKTFFVSLEYLPDFGSNTEPFRFSGQLFGESITRAASFGNWKRKKGITMSLYVNALE